MKEGDKIKKGVFTPSFFEVLKKAEENHFWFQVRRRWIFDKIQKVCPPPAKVLESGCGTGNVSSFLASRGYDVTGCEYYREALDLAWPGFSRVHAEASNLLFEDGSFDVVGLFDMLEHVEDDTAPLKEAFRVLRHGGVAVVTVPAREELWSQVDEVSFHKRRYTKNRLSRSLRAAGLVPLNIEYMFMALYLPMKMLRLRSVDVNAQFEVSMAMNTALRCWFDLERQMSRLVSLPVGTSLLATAVKK